MALQRVPINNFRGGLNVRDSPFELQPNESPDLLNVTISALVGQLEQRKGRTRVDIVGFPQEKADHAKQVVIGNEKRFLVLSINGSLWYMNPAGEVKKLFKGTAGTIWDFTVYADAAYKDWVYCLNGTDAPQKWDGEAAATVEWAAEKGSFPKGNTLTVWENRMFIAGVATQPQRVFFSEFADPEAKTKEYGFVDVRGSEEDLDAVQGIHVLGARLFILKRRSVYYISSAVTMLNRRVGGPGMFARFQCVELEDKLYFFNPQGIFSTGGVSVAMESGSINSYFPKNLNKAALAEVHIVATKDTYPRLLVAVPTGANTTPDTLIELIPHINFRRIGGRRYLLLPAFMLHTIPATCLACWNPTGTEEMVVTTALAEYQRGGSIVDTFNRAEENPLSKAGEWKKWAWTAKAGMIAKKALGAIAPISLEGARWANEVTSQPHAELDVVIPPTLQVALHICYLVAERTGCTARWVRVKVGILFEWQLELEEWNAGVRSNHSVFSLPNKFPPATKIGVQWVNNILSAWMNYGFGWVQVGSMSVEAGFSRGYSGFEFETGGTASEGTDGIFQNFSTGGGKVWRASRLFDGTTDEGEAIVAHWRSSWMAIQGEEPKERVRRLNVELQGDAIVDVFTDFETVPRFSETLEKAPVLGEPYRFTRVRPETRGRFHAVQFRSLPGGDPFLINVAELVIRGGKEH